MSWWQGLHYLAVLHYQCCVRLAAVLSLLSFFFSPSPPSARHQVCLVLEHPQAVLPAPHAPAWLALGASSFVGRHTGVRHHAVVSSETVEGFLRGGSFACLPPRPTHVTELVCLGVSRGLAKVFGSFFVYGGSYRGEGGCFERLPSRLRTPSPLMGRSRSPLRDGRRAPRQCLRADAPPFGALLKAGVPKILLRALFLLSLASKDDEERVDAIELFAGQKAITLSLQARGLVCIPFELVDSDLMDVMTDSGCVHNTVEVFPRRFP